MRAVATFAILLASHSLVNANDFRRDDSVIVLVSGPSAVSTPWGLSGQATMYCASSTHSSGKLGFSKVEGSNDVDCERRSAKRVNEPFDYSTSGQIPPGVYFVSYHRLDPQGDRHRLAIGDRPSGTTIQVKVGDQNVTRTDIQFHEAANNLATYSPRLSEGCIIFRQDNFRKLFPKDFLDPSTSPLAPSEPKLASANEFKGEGHVLVFVTDVTDAERTKKQIELFESILVGGELGLTAESFSANSTELAQIRLRW